MKINIYKCRLHHDNGTAYINVIATSASAAVNNVCMMENCPERSVTIIETKPLLTEKYYEN